jgi:hypothetical protein
MTTVVRGSGRCDLLSRLLRRVLDVRVLTTGTLALKRKNNIEAVQKIT